MIKTSTTTYQISLPEIKEIIADWLNVDIITRADITFTFIDVNGDECTLDRVIITEKN